MLLSKPNIDVNQAGWFVAFSSHLMSDQYGHTPLHYACFTPSDFEEDILDMLLCHEGKELIKFEFWYISLFTGINVTLKNKEGSTPLHYFVAKYRFPNCHEIFKVFIDKGADVNEKNNYGETPLHKAIFNKHVKLIMVQLLINAGADVNTKNQGCFRAKHH